MLRPNSSILRSPSGADNAASIGSYGEPAARQIGKWSATMDCLRAVGRQVKRPLTKGFWIAPWLPLEAGSLSAGRGICLRKSQLLPLSAHQHGAHSPGMDTTTRARLIASVRRYRVVFPNLAALCDAIEFRLLAVQPSRVAHKQKPPRTTVTHGECEMPEPISFTIDAEAWQHALLAIKRDVVDAEPVEALAVTLWDLLRG